MTRTFFVIFLFVSSNAVPYKDVNETKIFVDPVTNKVIKHESNVKPTAASNSHKPGIPPARTSFIHYITNAVTNDARPAPTTESTTIGFRPTVPGIPGEEFSSQIQNPNKNIFIDWILSLLGVPTKPPEQVTPPAYCAPCKCGLTYKHNRIVGGVETQVNEYVWMAFLTNRGQFYCGASLINNRYLLTAGHCVDGVHERNLGAVLLDHDRTSAVEARPIRLGISKIIQHARYGQQSSYNHDIALLKLDREVPIKGILRPVCLPNEGVSYTGYNGIVTGWGATAEHGPVSAKLKEVTVPIISNPDCRKTGYKNKITEYMLCAGFLEGGKDACQGDSGGPLHVLNDSLHSIVGIVSWGDGCAKENYPGVYTRVNRYLSWIEANTRDACYCKK